jgi:hypothetical protein
MPRELATTGERLTMIQLYHKRKHKPRPIKRDQTMEIATKRLQNYQ